MVRSKSLFENEDMHESEHDKISTNIYNRFIWPPNFNVRNINTYTIRSPNFSALKKR